MINGTMQWPLIYSCSHPEIRDERLLPPKLPYRLQVKLLAISLCLISKSEPLAPHWLQTRLSVRFFCAGDNNTSAWWQHFSQVIRMGEEWCSGGLITPVEPLVGMGVGRLALPVLIMVWVYGRMRLNRWVWSTALPWFFLKIDQKILHYPYTAPETKKAHIGAEM